MDAQVDGPSTVALTQTKGVSAGLSAGAVWLGSETAGRNNPYPTQHC